MTDQGQHPNGPTRNQERFLKDLQEETGCTFAWPRTFDEADREIKKLLKIRKMSRADRRRERHEVTRSLAEEFGDAAAIRDDELAGYGSTASWAGRHG